MKKEIRYFTVAHRLKCNTHSASSVFPQIKLEGDWLTELGFEFNTPVKMTAQYEKLMLEVIDRKDMPNEHS